MEPQENGGNKGLTIDSAVVLCAHRCSLLMSLGRPLPAVLPQYQPCSITQTRRKSTAGVDLAGSLSASAESNFRLTPWDSIIQNIDNGYGYDEGGSYEVDVLRSKWWLSGEKS